MADEEYELKLAIDPGEFAKLERAPPLADKVATAAATEATYYDTADHALRAAGVGLRVRSSNGRCVQTVKAGAAAAAGVFARAEWETPVPGAAPLIAADHPVRALVPAAVVDDVAAVFTVAVTRRTWLIEHEGSSIELVADEGLVAAGDRRGDVCEIELELKAGPPDGLFALARTLADAVPLRLGVLTKAERGYRLIGALPPEGAGAEPVALAAGATVADAFAAIVASCLRQFRLNEERLRDPGVSGVATEALHQGRVALRRLRAALRLFAPVAGDEDATRFGDALRELARVMGEARDLDVLIAGASATERAVLEPARIAAHGQARAALDSATVRATTIDLVAWTAIGGWRQAPVAQAPAATFLAERLDLLRRQVRRRGQHLAQLDDATRHRARIAAKRLRYAADFAAALFPEEAKRQRRFRRALARLQDRLGELNDLATGPGLRAAHGLPPVEPVDRDALLAAAERAYRTFVDAKRFWR